MKWYCCLVVVYFVTCISAQSGCKLKGTFTCTWGIISGLNFGNSKSDDHFEYYINDYDPITNTECALFQQGSYSTSKNIIFASLSTSDNNCLVSTNSTDCACMNSLQFSIRNNCGIIDGPFNETCTPAPICSDLLQCKDGEAPIDNPNAEPATNGCGPSSLPISGPQFSFGACCDQHDICYDTCGTSKIQCDNDFYQCMICKCREQYANSVTGTLCEELACTYFQAVNVFACPSFTSAQALACICPGESNQKQILEIEKPSSKFGNALFLTIRQTESIICNAPFEAECEAPPFEDGTRDTVFAITACAISFCIAIALICFLGYFFKKTYCNRSKEKMSLLKEDY